MKWSINCCKFIKLWKNSLFHLAGHTCHCRSFSNWFKLNTRSSHFQTIIVNTCISYLSWSKTNHPFDSWSVKILHLIFFIWNRPSSMYVFLFSSRSFESFWFCDMLNFDMDQQWLFYQQCLLSPYHYHFHNWTWWLSIDFEICKFYKFFIYFLHLLLWVFVYESPNRLQLILCSFILPLVKTNGLIFPLETPWKHLAW